MTREQALQHFGLTERDHIEKKGLLSIIESNEQLMKVWSVAEADRKQCEIEIEACKVLLQ